MWGQGPEKELVEPRGYHHSTGKKEARQQCDERGQKQKNLHCRGTMRLPTKYRNEWRLSSTLRTEVRNRVSWTMRLQQGSWMCGWMQCSNVWTESRKIINWTMRLSTLHRKKWGQSVIWAQRPETEPAESWGYQHKKGGQSALAIWGHMPETEPWGPKGYQQSSGMCGGQAAIWGQRPESESDELCSLHSTSEGLAVIVSTEVGNRTMWTKRLPTNLFTVLRAFGIPQLKFVFH